MDVWLCPLGELLFAISAAVDRVDQENRFQMMIHGVKVGGHRPPPRNPAEQDERVKETFAALGTVKVKRDAG